MRIFEYKIARNASAIAQDATLLVDLVTSVVPPHDPYIYFEYNASCSLPLAEARRLAKKILSMPTPIGFEDIEAAS